jgi:hydrogenase maturation protease
MRVLVAGIGNVFLGDDGWGPAVIQALRAVAWPHGVEVEDFGVRGVELARSVARGCDAVIVVDAMTRGGEPGTLYVVEPKVPKEVVGIDVHEVDPARVLAFARSLGPLPTFIRVIGCEPGSFVESGADVAVALGPAVAAAIRPAVTVVRELVAELTAETIDMELE